MGSELAASDVSNAIFAIASIATGIIAFKCSTAPNPKPAHAEKNDILFNGGMLSMAMNSGVYFGKWCFVASGFLAAILSLDSRKGGLAITRTVCPNYSNLAVSHVKPGAFSIGCLVVAIGFGLLRLEAYRQLGKNFTFQIAKPSGLMTSGLYGWMQHPSYTGILFFTTAIFLLWMQPHGVLGCFIPAGLAKKEWLWWCYRVQYLATVAYMTRGRVLQEERMMKREFGREWEEYHASVARFIPGVF